jgi:hypothetical protein
MHQSAGLGGDEDGTELTLWILGAHQSKIVDDDPLCWLEFTPDAIITSCKKGKLVL